MNINKLPLYNNTIDLMMLLNGVNLNKKYMGVYLAGGYLRDIEHSIIPKDSDIFICPMTDKQIRYTADIQQPTRTFLPRRRRYIYYNYGAGMRKDVNYIVKYGCKYDVIVMHTGIEDVIRNFDMSICQIYGYIEDGELLVKTTHQYEDYKTNKIIWIYEDIETTASHINRITAKFPDAIFKSMHSSDVIINDAPRKLRLGLG